MASSQTHYTWTSIRLRVLCFPVWKSMAVSFTFHQVCVTQLPSAGGSDVQLMVGWSFVKTASNLAQFCFLPDHCVILWDSTHCSAINWFGQRRPRKKNCTEVPQRPLPTTLDCWHSMIFLHFVARFWWYSTSYCLAPFPHQHVWKFNNTNITFKW